MANENLRALLNRLSNNLARIKEIVKIENASGDYSYNKFLETSMLKVYNVGFEVDLINTNIINSSYPGIDGIDIKNGIIAQITSTFSNEKIEHTIDKILEKELYKSDTKLVFLFLSDKRKLQPAFVNRIKKKINGRFQFDLDTDLLDLNDIYKFHYNYQKADKILQVVGILEESLNLLPAEKQLGFDSIMVCFHEEEMENVFELVDNIIKEGINVYINSKKLHDKFVQRNNPRKDYIIYADSTLSFDHINFCITVLSNAFINQNLLHNVTPQCHLFKAAIQNDIRIEAITFDNFLKEAKKISIPRLKSYSSINKSNVVSKVKSILSERIKESAYSSISLQEISDELIYMHKNFKATKIIDDNEFIFLNLIMEEQDEVELNYLILPRDYNLSNALSHYIANLKESYSRNLNVLVPKDFGHKSRKRLQAVINGFDSNKVYFIDEYLFDKRYKTLEQKVLSLRNGFIYPFVKCNGEFLGINDIIYWIINNSDSSVAIINGSGGIGKTTICEKIHDSIIEDHDRNIVIFIDAQQYIDVFKKRRFAEEAEYDLYNIFKACHPHANVIDKNSFYINYALGNIIIIFDGVDEIISTIPSFNLYQFIENLESLRLRIGRGKILINCRDTYVKDLIKFYERSGDNRITNIKIYDLLGFDDSLARQFFNHLADSDTEKVCMRLVKEFYPESDVENSFRYHPFILEIIAEMVSNGLNYEEIQYDFTSNILQYDEFNDILIFRICNREIIKKEEYGFHLDVDNQILFFCLLAIEEKGEIQDTDFEKLLSKLGLNDRLLDFSKSLKDHPLLLTKQKNEYVFRFAFFNTYFKALAIFNLLSADSKIQITERLVNILCYECNYNSVIAKSLSFRLAKKDFDCVLEKSKNIILKLHSSFKIDNRIKKSISNLLIILLKTPRKSEYSTTYIIKHLFGWRMDDEKPIIEHFYLHDVPSIAEIIIDFNDLIFIDSEIVNYSNFFKCSFNQDTLFTESCLISNVFNNKINLRTIKVSLDNFDKNIKGDNSIFKLLKLMENENLLVDYFKNYLKAFYNNRHLELKKEEKEISIFIDEDITVRLLTRILKQNGIVEKVEEGVVYLSNRFDTKIFKYLTQAISFTELRRCVKDLESNFFKNQA